MTISNGFESQPKLLDQRLFAPRDGASGRMPGSQALSIASRGPGLDINVLRGGLPPQNLQADAGRGF